MPEAPRKARVSGPQLDFEQTADWRGSKAAEHPEDSRNLEAAALLDKLAASVETVAPDLLDANAER